MTNKTLGIDIGSTTLKLCLLSDVKGCGCMSLSLSSLWIEFRVYWLWPPGRCDSYPPKNWRS